MENQEEPFAEYNPEIAAYYSKLKEATKPKINMNKYYNTYTETNNLATTKKYEWLKNILIMASTLIGILVSLHSKKSPNAQVHYLFSTTIISLGLGILTGAISLFAEVHTLEKAAEACKERILQALDGKEDILPLMTVPREKIFFYIEKICYASFVISILCLMAYAAVIDTW
jgi:hypothetical protein